MNMEEIENLVEDLKLIRESLGFMSVEHLEEFKFNAIQGMHKFGGSFSRALGLALSVADRQNSIKIMRYWNQDCEKYSIMFKMFLAKEGIAYEGE